MELLRRVGTEVLHRGIFIIGWTLVIVLYPVFGALDYTMRNNSSCHVAISSLMGVITILMTLGMVHEGVRMDVIVAFFITQYALGLKLFLAAK